MSKKYNYNILLLILFLVISIGLSACVSQTEEGQEVKKPDVLSRISLPKSPYFKGFNTYAFVQEPSLIRKIIVKLFENSTIDTTLLGSLIKKIYVNSLDNDFVTFVEASFDSLVNKKNIIEVANMQEIGDDGRLWARNDPELGILYFDILYRNVIGITNVDPEMYLSLRFDWSLHADIKDIVTSDSEFWLYGTTLDFTDKFAFNNDYFPEWGFISANGYDTAGYLLTTVAIPYSGLRKYLVTIKIILPSILKNFDVRDITSLPSISSVNTTMIIDGIYISPKKINEYILHISSFTEK